MADVKKSISLTGVPNAGAWGYLVSLLRAGSLPDERLAFVSKRPLVVVRQSEEELEDVADAFKALAPLTGAELGAAAFFGEDPATRLASLERLYAGCGIVWATAESLTAGVSGKKEYQKRRLSVRSGGDISRKGLLKGLDRLGYARVDFVESPGEYAVRGAVVDFFPFEPAKAVRLLTIGDRIESIRSFDPQTQAGGADLWEEAVATPAHEPAGGTPLGEVLASYGVWIVEQGVDMPKGVAAAVRVGPSAPGAAVDFGARQSLSAGGDLDRVAERCRELSKEGMKVCLYSLNRGEDERIQEIFEERLKNSPLQYTVGPLRHGFAHPDTKVATITSAEIFGRRYRRSRILKPVLGGRARVHWNELKKGDYVVHEGYGIARYLGLEAVTVSGGHRAEAQGDTAGVMDCLRLEFRNSDVLFVPMTDFRGVQKFVGGEGHRPRLSSLDSRNWADVKERVKEGVRELAEKLLKTHAERRARPGHGFGPDTHMEHEFAQSFPYEETPDQRRAIADVKDDMA